MSISAQGINLANQVIQDVQSTGLSETKFEHPEGKWYTLKVTWKKDDPDRYFVERSFGGSGNRRPGQLNREESAETLTKVVQDRVAHGYMVAAAK